ncbi:hypothetical protein [Rhodoferax sp. U11-2br]|uniref:hypothetical protein n=1 Tax=Rhodoferax sp. U11-2br TaxID=2838878 RepID=UPI001BE92BA3|nr:hypothetical protein [Rhodoferax sp. U11-2br]MBT3066042.1 hypothetical protein [Rhodoferax sp. U11-2br]
MGDPGFIVFLALIGLLPAIAIPTQLVRMAQAILKVSPIYSVQRRLAAISQFLLLTLFLFGSVWFAWVFYQEMETQLKCRGAGCAQGGMGMFVAVFIVAIFEKGLRAISTALWPVEVSPNIPSLGFFAVFRETPKRIDISE